MANIALALRATANITTQIWQKETDSVVNSTQTVALINSLVFAESKSVRTSTLILGAFNILAASASGFSILYDCYWSSKRCSPDGRAQKFCISKIHPAETFPLVLAIGVVIQGCAFVAAQSVGMSSLLTNGCANVAQYTFPAIFLVPYIQIVFGIECAIRSLRKQPFQPRGKYDVTICLVVVLLMGIGTWVPTHLNKEMDRCFASLVWFVGRFGLEGTVLYATVGALAIASAILIFVRLSTVSSVDHNQRIAASRMVYYLAMSIVSLAFVIPWFVTLVLGRPSIISSMMATVVLNLTGLMNGALHLFLRSNTATTSFGPRGSASWRRSTHTIRIWGPNELGFDGHILDPVSGPRPNSSASDASLVRMEKRPMSMESEVNFPMYTKPFNAQLNNSIVNMPQIPEPTAAGSPKRSTSRTHARKQSYSLFPSGGQNPTDSIKPQLPATTFSQPQSHPPNNRQDLETIYIGGDLEPPTFRFGGPGGARHRRDSSMVSSATVQIGLRLSHAMPENLSNLPLPQTTYSQRPSSPLLQIKTQNLTIPTSKLQVQQPPPTRPSAADLKVPERDSRMKTLPPVPKRADGTPVAFEDIEKALGKAAVGLEQPKMEAEDEDETVIQLSPTVYSPTGSKKTPAPMAPSQEQTSTPSPRAMSPRGLGAMTMSPQSSSPRLVNPSRARPVLASPKSVPSNSDWI